MEPDDIVIFTRGHYDVLREYQVVREISDRREQRIGRVMEVGDGFVRVLWIAADKMTCHFPDNLQVLRSRRGHELVG